MVKKSSVVRSKKTQKHDEFEPTRMGLAVAAAAAVVLVLLGLIATL